LPLGFTFYSIFSIFSLFSFSHFAMILNVLLLLLLVLSLVVLSFRFCSWNYPGNLTLPFLGLGNRTLIKASWELISQVMWHSLIISILWFSWNRRKTAEWRTQTSKQASKAKVWSRRLARAQRLRSPEVSLCLSYLTYHNATRVPSLWVHGASNYIPGRIGLSYRSKMLRFLFNSWVPLAIWDASYRTVSFGREDQQRVVRARCICPTKDHL